MEQLVSYRKFTSTFLEKLKNRRDSFFEAVKIPNTTNTHIKDVLIKLLVDDPKGYDYSEWIQSKILFKKIYHELIT
jgi:hypothetical protein